MAYQVRFESNAFQADSAIGKALDALDQTIKGVKRSVGIKLREDQVNRNVKLRGVCQRTFAASMDWADKDFDQQIVSEKWKWRGSTVETARKNGQVVTEPRDIIDTSALLNSKRREDINSSVTEFEWTEPHAESVHDGYTDKRNNLKLPARPWTEETAQDLLEVVDTIFKKETN